MRKLHMSACNGIIPRGEEFPTKVTLENENDNIVAGLT